MKYHPIANIFPLMEGEDFDGLVEDIKAHGLRDSIWTYEDKILDGRNRFRACKKAKVEVKSRAFRGSAEAALAFVVSTNLRRRHLNESQRAMVAARMANLSDGQTKGASQICEPVTQPEAATQVNVSSRSVWAAKKVLAEGTPDQIKAVESGKVKVSKVVHAIKKAEQKRERVEIAKKAEKLKGGDKGVRIGDFRKVLADVKDGSTSLIFTDPPYDRASVDLYADLGEFAARTLMPGGSLLCYCGHYLVPDVIERLAPHLRYWWLCGVQHEGGNCARMREYGVVVRWKPILWFVKDTRGDKDVFVDDLVASPAPEKDHHDWQQSVVEAQYYIETLTIKGELVVDPFCGGGTTALAAKQLGRTWLTCDIDKEAALISRRRLA